MKIISTAALLFLTATLSQAQINNGLVASFSFSGNLTDNSSSNIQLVNHGTSFTQDASNIANSALALSGGDYLSFNSNAVKTPFPITISAYVKLDDLSGVNTIFNSDNEFNHYHGYWFNITPSGQLALNYSGADGGQSPSNRRTFITSQSIQTGQWYQLIGIIRGSQDMSIYVDCNELTGTYNGTGDVNVSYSNFDSYIGQFIGATTLPNGLPFNGSIDELNIWSRELTASEIGDVCNNTLAIEDNKMENLTIFPNPSKDIVNITFENAGAHTVTVIDNVGHTLENITSSNGTCQVDVTQYASGVYTIIIQYSGGKSTHKIIKF